MKILKKIVHYAVVAFWLVYGAAALWNAIQAHASLLQFILAVNILLFGYFLLVRREERSNPFAWYVQVPILFSIFLGYFYKFQNPTPVTGIVISFIGSLLSMWALISLGKSFGIAPADRGLVMRGPYRFLRHPMYSGYLLIDLPLLIWNVSPWNLMIFSIKIVSFVIRILLEERVVSDYSSYIQKVRWRLIPFVW
jgi:protein-S-isoprenylcysteine O-methyltransferase Ste14